MGQHHSPRIVTDGLCLYMDAANVKSFRGEPTTNLFTNHTTAVFQSAYNGAAYGFGASTNIQQVVDTERLFPDSIITKVSRINADVSQYDYVLNSISSNIGETKTLSFWYYGTFGTAIYPYNNDGSANLYYLDSNGNWQGGATGISIPVPTFEWRQIIIKIVNKGSINGTGLTWTILHSNSTAATLNTSQYFSFTRWQVEAKDHATPFVVGTRGTTVATGGGWADLSGNSHHGVIVSSPTYSSSNLGSLLFNGAGNYLTFGTGESFFPLPQFTLDVWSKSSGYGSGMSVGGIISITYGIGFRYTYGGYFNFYLDNGTEFIHLSSPSSMMDGNWHNLVATTTGGKMQIFIDGLYSNQNDVVWMGYTRWPTNTCYIGADANNPAISYLAGNIASTKVYSRVLSNDEILLNYRATKGRFGL